MANRKEKMMWLNTPNTYTEVEEGTENEDGEPKTNTVGERVGEGVLKLANCKEAQDWLIKPNLHTNKVEVAEGDDGESKTKTQVRGGVG